jgi:hypothetical protein
MQLQIQPSGLPWREDALLWDQSRVVYHRGYEDIHTSFVKRRETVWSGILCEAIADYSDLGRSLAPGDFGQLSGGIARPLAFRKRLYHPTEVLAPILTPEFF